MTKKIKNTYKIIDSNNKTLILSGGTKLEGFKTKEEAQKCLESYHQKAIDDNEEIHTWGAIAIKE